MASPWVGGNKGNDHDIDDDNPAPPPVYGFLPSDDEEEDDADEESAWDWFSRLGHPHETSSSDPSHRFFSSSWRRRRRRRRRRQQQANATETDLWNAILLLGKKAPKELPAIQMTLSKTPPQWDEWNRVLLPLMISFLLESTPPCWLDKDNTEEEEDDDVSIRQAAYALSWVVIWDGRCTLDGRWLHDTLQRAVWQHVCRRSSCTTAHVERRAQWLWKVTLARIQWVHHHSDPLQSTLQSMQHALTQRQEEPRRTRRVSRNPSPASTATTATVEPDTEKGDEPPNHHQEETMPKENVSSLFPPTRHNNDKTDNAPAPPPPVTLWIWKDWDSTTSAIRNRMEALLQPKVTQSGLSGWTDLLRQVAALRQAHPVALLLTSSPGEEVPPPSWITHHVRVTADTTTRLVVAHAGNQTTTTVTPAQL